MLIKLNSTVCTSEYNCYPVETEIPLWMLILLIGSGILITKELYNLLIK